MLTALVGKRQAGMDFDTAVNSVLKNLVILLWRD